jgi:hypothetical protein
MFNDALQKQQINFDDPAYAGCFFKKSFLYYFIDQLRVFEKMICF